MIDLQWVLPPSSYSKLNDFQQVLSTKIQNNFQVNVLLTLVLAHNQKPSGTEMMKFHCSFKRKKNENSPSNCSRRLYMEKKRFGITSKVYSQTISNLTSFLYVYVFRKRQSAYHARAIAYLREQHKHVTYIFIRTQTHRAKCKKDSTPLMWLFRKLLLLFVIVLILLLLLLLLLFLCSCCLIFVSSCFVVEGLNVVILLLFCYCSFIVVFVAFAMLFLSATL